MIWMEWTEMKKIKSSMEPESHYMRIRWLLKNFPIVPPPKTMQIIVDYRKCKSFNITAEKTLKRWRFNQFIDKVERFWMEATHTQYENALYAWMHRDAKKNMQISEQENCSLSQCAPSSCSRYSMQLFKRHIFLTLLLCGVCRWVLDIR